jgi:hypothetical protein
VVFKGAWVSRRKLVYLRTVFCLRGVGQYGISALQDSPFRTGCRTVLCAEYQYLSAVLMQHPTCVSHCCSLCNLTSCSALFAALAHVLFALQRVHWVLCAAPHDSCLCNPLWLLCCVAAAAASALLLFLFCYACCFCPACTHALGPMHLQCPLCCAVLCCAVLHLAPYALCIFFWFAGFAAAVCLMSQVMVVGDDGNVMSSGSFWASALAALVIKLMIAAKR